MTDKEEVENFEDEELREDNGEEEDSMEEEGDDDESNTNFDAAQTLKKFKDQLYGTLNYYYTSRSCL
jgi:hypothetical protein